MRKPDIHVRSAVEAGIAGALSITVVTGICRALGVPVNIEMLLGTLFGLPVGIGAWILGLFLHMAAGACFGLIYAAIFESHLIAQTRPRAVAVGFVHGIIAGFLIEGLAGIHPGIPEYFVDPGYFYSKLGWYGVVMFLGLHAVFGAFVASLYRVDEDETGDEQDWFEPAA